MSWPNKFLTSAVALDPAEGGKGGDYSACVFTGWARSKFWVDAELVREPPEAAVARSIEMADRYHAEVIGAEAQVMKSLLAREYRAQYQGAGLIPRPLHLIRQSASKASRIMSLGAYLARGELMFRDTPGCRLLVRQLKDFPYADHDDGPDALHMAVRLLVGLASRDLQLRSQIRNVEPL